MKVDRIDKREIVPNEFKKKPTGTLKKQTDRDANTGLGTPILTLTQGTPIMSLTRHASHGTIYSR